LEAIRKLLRPALRDRSVRFVFPSEICAEAWLAESLRMGVGAIEADRFLGWDRFKEAAARVDGRPASDDYIRRIFAANLLSENAVGPFLSSLLPPAYAGLWQPFAGYLASRLPALGRLPNAMREAGRVARGDPALADWLDIRERYETFLRGIGRFEPSYEPQALRDLQGKTMIFLPELIEDFEEYRAVLETAPSIVLVGLPAERPAPRSAERPEVQLRKPETALAELRQVLAEVGELLDSGLETERIAITVAGLDRYRPYLEREAILFSVPLAVRSGLNLSATPGGRLFAALRDLYSSGFSFDALRDLVMSPAWPWKGPWKNPGLGRQIITEGLRLHAVASWPECGKTADAWERSLDGSLLSAYRRLKSRVTAIAAAADFRSLLKAYNAFRAEFLSPERDDWDKGADLTLARCVVELEGLVHAQGQTGLEVTGAFGIFMRALDSKPYVSSAAGDGGTGVPVYEWRVAAGICPERHFILNASQDALALPSRGFDFLAETLRKELGTAGDAAPAFIKAYALSGTSVSFSCPEAGFGGEEAVHGFLVSMSREDAVEGPRDFSYREEAAWLSGRGPAPKRIHKTQVLGLAAATAASFAASGDGAFLEPATAVLAARRLYREGEARPGIDSTSIDDYHSCPYAFLYLRLLRAGPEPSGIAFADALFMGEVYHSALAILFARIRDADGRFKSERVEAYRGLVGNCLDEAFAQLANKRGAFVGVVLETYRGRLERYLQNLVTVEAERFPSLAIRFLEAEFELEYPEVAGGVVLRGRIDRISRSEKGAIVVDYKKGGLPTKAQVAPDADGNIAEAQIPCYIRLVTDGGPIMGAEGPAVGTEIDSAWYISIEGDSNRKPGTAACAFGAPTLRLGSAPGPTTARGDKVAYVPQEGLAPFLDAFDEALRRTVEGIFAGAFPLAPKESQKMACANCGARGICRERYALRFGVNS
jgi:hypothetical protein